MRGMVRRRVSVQVGLAILLVLAAPMPAGAQQAPAPAVRMAVPQSGMRTPSREQRRRVAQAAGHLVLLLALTGALALVLLVLWGFRVRRQIRRPLPHVSATDDLWYLRPARHRPAASPDLPASDDSKDDRRP